MAGTRGGSQRARRGTRTAELEAKPVSASRVQMAELVLPNDTNTLGSLRGGQLMHWIDIACAMAGQRHSRRAVVTAVMDRVNFLHPVKVGQQVTIYASVNAAWGTSMEVGARVEAEDPQTGVRVHTASAYATFVALDDDLRPVPVPPLALETEVDRRRWEEAQVRRRLRLAERAQRAVRHGGRKKRTARPRRS